jgi:hypothetical protein
MIKFYSFGLMTALASLSMGTANAYSMEAYCNKVMATPSQQWVAKQQDEMKGIAIYSDCYLGKLDDIQRQLNASGKGPLMGANGDFKDMQAALQKFTDAGLNAIQATPAHKAYVGLYQQQFRNYFYQNYLANPKLPTSTPEAVSVAKAVFEQELNQLPSHQTARLAKLFNDFYTEATNLGMPAVTIYRHAAFVLQAQNSQLSVPAPF